MIMSLNSREVLYSTEKAVLFNKFGSEGDYLL